MYVSKTDTKFSLALSQLYKITYPLIPSNMSCHKLQKTCDPLSGPAMKPFLNQVEMKGSASVLNAVHLENCREVTNGLPPATITWHVAQQLCFASVTQACEGPFHS